ncbi:MAG: flagellar biosynthetic protein FliQ [Vampirovibrionales bacterium]|jgi:flagellar biosynthetic protein FliQ
MDYLLEHVRQGILLSLMLSMPPILAAAVIGLIVGILQAVTQVQEQTLSAVPKMIVVFLILILAGGTMLEMSGQYIRESMQLAFQVVPATGHFLLPPQQKNAGYQKTAGEKGTVYMIQEKRQARNSAQASRKTMETP